MTSYQNRRSLTPVEACHSFSRWGRYQWAQLWTSDWEFKIEWEFDYAARVCHLRFLRQGVRRTQDVRLWGIPQKFGGEMFFLICPECGTKRGKLFLPDNWYLDQSRGIMVRLFLCWDCYRLTYLQRRRALVNQIHAQEYRLERHEAKYFQETDDPDHLYKKRFKYYAQFDQHYAKYQEIAARVMAADNTWGSNLAAKMERLLEFRA